MSKTPSKAWLIWGIASVFVLYQFLIQASTSVMIPQLIHDLSTTIVGVSFLSSLFFYPYLLLQIPSGLLVDRYGPRVVLIVPLMVCVFASLGFGLAHHLLSAEIARLLMGIAASPSVAVAMYLATRWFPRRQFALIAGLTEMIGLSGGGILPVLSFFVEHLGWRMAMAISALAGIALTGLAWYFVFDNEQAPQVNRSQHFVWKNVTDLLKMPQAWLSGFYAGLVFALVPAFASLWGIPFLENVYHFSLQKAAFSNCLVFIGTGIGAPVMGWLSDKLGKRRPVMALGTFLCLLLVLSVFWLTPPNGFILDVELLLAGFFSGSYALAFVIMREITPVENDGTAMGYTNMMCILIGAPVLQPLIGILLRVAWDGKLINGVAYYSASDYRLALIVIPLCLVLALIITFFIKETGE